MVGGRLVVPAALAAGVALTVVLVAVALRDAGSSGESELEARVRPTVRATFVPPVHAFGQPVTARLELLVRAAELDLSTLRPASDFEPYEIVGTPRREVTDFGALRLVRYTIVLQCLKQACLPDTETGEVEFGSADPRLGSAGFTWRTPPPPGRKFRDRRLDARSASGEWPPLKVVSRLTPAQIDDAAWRSSLAELPRPSYRISPRWLAAGLLGLSAALVLAAAALVARYAMDARRRAASARAAVEQADEQTPLEQALGLLEHARGNGDLGEQRVALETLARELYGHGESQLAADAERLAWSPGAPAAVEVDELTASVSRLNGDVA